MTAPDDMPPEWAIKRACELANAEEPTCNWQGPYLKSLLVRGEFVVPSMRALIKHIAAHEQEPVDPIEHAIACSIASLGTGFGTMTIPEIADFLRRDLRARGIELAREQQP